jgi:arginine repressor-like DNA binding protein
VTAEVGDESASQPGCRGPPFGDQRAGALGSRGAGPHMIVFETTAGAAKAVAAALKAANWPEVRGILTEDETLFVATDNVYDSRLLLQRMRRIIGKR